MDEASAGSGAYFGAIGDTDEIRVLVVAVLAVEVFALGDDKGLDLVACLLAERFLSVRFGYRRSSW
jgi:hypothetical protein